MRLIGLTVVFAVSLVAAPLAAQAQPAGKVVINLKTAKALGLTIPQSVLGRADQVIE